MGDNGRRVVYGGSSVCMCVSESYGHLWISGCLWAIMSVDMGDYGHIWVLMGIYECLCVKGRLNTDTLPQNS